MREDQKRVNWETWLAVLQVLSERILGETSGEPLDVELILAEARADLDSRHDYLVDD